MSNSEAPVLDFMGRAIKAGDIVCYPVRRGSSMWLSKITVTQVVPGPTPSLGGFNSDGRKFTIHNIGNVIVAEPVKAT